MIRDLLGLLLMGLLVVTGVLPALLILGWALGQPTLARDMIAAVLPPAEAEEPVERRLARGEAVPVEGVALQVESIRGRDEAALTIKACKDHDGGFASFWPDGRLHRGCPGCAS